jgi:hypothetical protein
MTTIITKTCIGNTLRNATNVIKGYHSPETLQIATSSHACMAITHYLADHEHNKRINRWSSRSRRAFLHLRERWRHEARMDDWAPELRGASVNSIEGHCKNEIPPTTRTLTANSAKEIISLTCELRSWSAQITLVTRNSWQYLYPHHSRRAPN